VRADVVNGADHGLAQTRRRLFVVGVRPGSGLSYAPPVGGPAPRRTLRDAIGDLEAGAVESDGWATVDPRVNAHEYVPLGLVGVTRWFLSSQRVRSWDEPGFVVPAKVTSVSFHPSAPKMQQLPGPERAFRLVPGHAYRKLSVRECARIQGFPDDFHFVYTHVGKAHRMVGNAVPPPLAAAVARAVLAGEGVGG
jgi:DNA (cytosine-5)-methyltransferase 1